MTNNETSQALIAAQQLVRYQRKYCTVVQTLACIIGMTDLLVTGMMISMTLGPSGHLHGFWWWLLYGLSVVAAICLIGIYGRHAGLESYIQAREEVAVQPYIVEQAANGDSRCQQ